MSGLLQQDLDRWILMQTLTSLDLISNEIGPEGARHLAQSLLSNRVSEPIILSVKFQSVFGIDTCET